jgi:hypothetical protein
MLRAFFLAIGIYMCILGGECLVVERFVMAQEPPPADPSTPATLFGAAATPAPVRSDIEPPDWVAWSLLSTGAVVILLAITIKRQG